MPRRTFTADVASLSFQAASTSFPNLRQVRFDNDSDEVLAVFAYEKLGAPARVCILCADMDSYPESCRYFLSLDDGDGLDDYAQAISALQNETKTRSLSQLVRKIDRLFTSLATGSWSGGSRPEESVIIISDSDDSNDSDRRDGQRVDVTVGHGTKSDPIDITSDDDTSDSDATGVDLLSTDIYADLDSPSRRPHPGQRTSLDLQHHSSYDIEGSIDVTNIQSGPVAKDAEDNTSPALPNPLQKRISRDLRAVRQAGFYFGVLRGMTGASEVNLLSISVRVSTLELSQKMLLAWDLDPRVYIVLLIRLTSRYTAYETLVKSVNSEVGLSFCIGKCPHYKPSIENAEAAFGRFNDSAKRKPLSTDAGFSKILITSSLGKFMSDYFLPLARWRDSEHCSWMEAVNALVNQEGYRGGSGQAAGGPGGLVTSSTQKSLPLVAMQFAVERLKNCTKYCHACHRWLDKGVGSLKPTVCSRELCLFQYIQMGLGRSVEYEILSQPNVVDLLVNFCYAALWASQNCKAGPIRTYPTALPLRTLDLSDGVGGVFDKRNNGTPSVVLPNQALLNSFQPGQWVAIRFKYSMDSTAESMHIHKNAAGEMWFPWYSNLRHATITGVDHGSSTIYLSHCHLQYPDAESVHCQIFRYVKDFDEVPNEGKAALLLHVLDTLPPIAILKSHLEKPAVTCLQSVPGVSPAAAILLGWIIATNRSCILQIHEPKLQVHVGTAANNSVPNMWLQFCFLQGSPVADKRFQDELQKAVAKTGNRKHPTLLAWHGSKISNWHSILRTGLDYQNIVNGRAFGNGVYFSHTFDTSLSYTTSNEVVQWPRAVLDLCSVVSLNEIINAPFDFASSSPHYVVAQRDWSRCRFLFAKTKAYNQNDSNVVALSGGQKRPSGGFGNLFGGFNAVARSLPSIQAQAPSKIPVEAQAFFDQDPQRVAYGPSGQPILVPVASMPSSSQAAQIEQPSRKRQRSESPTKSSQEEHAEMIETGDMAFLLEDDDWQNFLPNSLTLLPKPAPDEHRIPPAHRAARTANMATGTPASTPAAVAKQPINSNVTAFQPGTLDYNSLLLLPPPSWGASQGQKALGREVDRMQKLQLQTKPLADLGWYIDFARLDNLFQWIVELHSFDRDLPLAQDMEKQGVTAIVCELRFGADYPWSPPLVRVIRPRFLPFVQGGGGHVTAGGSLCMELLTSSGWSPANQIDAVLLQVRLALCSMQPPARLDRRLGHGARDYDIGEAVEAYRRSAAIHGWDVPSDMAARVTF